MKLRCTSCANFCCDAKKCSCNCHKKSFSRTNSYLSNVMDVLTKQKIKNVKSIDLSWQTSILGSMMRLE
ncbi:MAG: hypothetical protein VX721_03950 [Thermoproteota archaeon]|nr:hypothetical protein [Thermoproteota archaeon]MED5543227.1 hypothetical protein [Thermoproteota archaeon]